MGGTVKLCIRDTNSKIHNLKVYTNFLSYAVLHSDILLCKQEGVDYIVQKAINIYGEEDCNSTLSPEGYGLVYLDLLKKVVISNQGYTNLKSLSCMNISRFSNKELSYFAENNRSHNEWVQQFIELYNNNLIKKKSKYYLFENDKLVDKEYTFTSTNLEEFLIEIKNYRQLTDEFSIPVKIDKLFKFYNFDDYELDTYRKIKKQIRKLGIEYTKEDEFAWIDWLQYL